MVGHENGAARVSKRIFEVCCAANHSKFRLYIIRLLTRAAPSGSASRRDYLFYSDREKNYAALGETPALHASRFFPKADDLS
jgi:hypothetical protein